MTMFAPAFPTALDTVDTIGAASNLFSTTLSADISDSDATIPLTSTAAAPASGCFVLRIGDEFIFAASKDSDSANGCLRGQDGSTAAAHTSGTAVYGYIAAAHYSVLRAAIIALETKLGIGASVPTTAGHVLAVTGAGATAFQAAAGGDALSIDVNTAVSVSGAITLNSGAFGKWHICSGSSYTLGLPAVSGNAGKKIGLIMAAGLTGIVTLDGNGSEEIDEAPTRIMHDNETAVLYCDGTAWTKLAGKTIPMCCTMRLESGTPGVAQSIPNTTPTKILLNQVDVDNTGLMANTGANRVDIVRSSLYTVDGLIYYTSAAGTRFICQVYNNGVEMFSAEIGSASSSTFPNPTAASERELEAGNQIELSTYQNSGGAVYVYGADPGASCLLRLVEIPSW